MRFWKFEYDSPEELRKCIAEQRLPSSIDVPGLSNTYDHPVKSLKTGDGVIVAKLDENKAKIYAVGKVRTIASDRSTVIIDWAQVRETRFPNPQGGLPQWQTKTAFEISPSPAKEYDLTELVDRHVRPSNVLANQEFYDSESTNAIEGYLLDSKLLKSSRNSSLASKRKALDNHTCQACSFRFQLGERYVIDVHHLNPLGASGETITTLEDLVSLCPTCHRIAHMRNPPYSINEIREFRNHDFGKA